MTPREYAALVKRRALDIDREDYRAALVCATLVNIHRRKGKPPIKPEAFLGKKATKSADTKTPWQEQLKVVEALNKALGGKDARKKGKPS